MIQLILLSLLADPSGLQAALLEADGVEVSYARTNATIDIKGDEVKRLAKLIKVNDDVVLLEYTGGVPSTNDAFVIRPYKGKKVTEYTELGGRILVFGDRSVTFANTEFHLALRDYFEARKLPPTLKPEVVREIKGVTVAVQAVSDDGMYLLTAGDGLSVFNLNAKGAGTSLGKTIKHERLAHAKALASKGNFIFVAGGVDVVVFRRFGASYEVVDTAPASANALHVSGNKLYAACTGKVQVYTIDDNGKLHLDQSLTVEGNLLTDLATNGGYLYVVTRESLFTFKDGQLVATETDKLDRGHFKPQDRGLRLASALVVDGDKLYIAGWGGSLSVWEIKEGKPVFIKCLRDDRGAEGIEYAKDIVIGDGRLWVIGQRDESLAWFEWKEDDLVCGGSIEVGPFDSLASHDKFLFLGGHEKLKILRTEPFRNPIPRPE